MILSKSNLSALRWNSILLVIALIILIENGAVEAADDSRRKRPQRNASRSRRGLMNGLGALDHTGKAADGWQKILDHLNGTDPPSNPPSVTPDRAGTGSPSIIEIPTDEPSKTTSSPTASPTKLPTKGPTKSPSSAPTKNPTKYPTPAPVEVPVFTRTSRPTASPTKSTPSPTNSPSPPPTKSPTGTPTKKPSAAPTKSPTDTPTKKPSVAPTKNPTSAPTKKPSSAPTKKPTVMPTKTPTGGPTMKPTSTPTKKPTSTPTVTPTKATTPAPMSVPSKGPQPSNFTSVPTKSPTSKPIESPSPLPTESPSANPTKNPSNAPTEKTPISSPTSEPSKTQTSSPTNTSTGIPSLAPSSAPIDPLSPTKPPSISPSESPSTKPSPLSTRAPTISLAPSGSPSEEPSATPSATGSPTLTVAPTKDDVSDSAVFCPGVESSSVSRLEVWWKYAVHFSAGVNKTSEILLLEMKLATELEDEVLQCPEGSDSRRLEGEEGIVGIDYLPLDEPIEEGEQFPMNQNAAKDKILSSSFIACPGVSVNCVVYKGTVSLYLKDDGSVDGAIETTRKRIVNIMGQNADEIMGDGISKIEYLSPDMQTSAAQGSRTGDNVSAGDESSSTPTAVMVSVGVVCAAIALTMGYRYKNRVDDAALSTIGPCGSQLTMTSSQLSGNTDGTPGLSTVMPSTYRLGESHCMDAILEGGDSSDTSSQARNVSLDVSEGGYSQEDSRTFPRENFNMNQSGDYLLGAQRPGSNYQMDQLLLSDSFSDIEPPYDSSLDESSFREHRETYTGQSNPLGPSPLAFLDQDDSYNL